MRSHRTRGEYRARWRDGPHPLSGPSSPSEYDIRHCCRQGADAFHLIHVKKCCRRRRCHARAPGIEGGQVHVPDAAAHSRPFARRGNGTALRRGWARMRQADLKQFLQPRARVGAATETQASPSLPGDAGWTIARSAGEFLRLGSVRPPPGAEWPEIMLFRSAQSATSLAANQRNCLSAPAAPGA